MKSRRGNVEIPVPVAAGVVVVLLGLAGWVLFAGTNGSKGYPRGQSPQVYTPAQIQAQEYQSFQEKQARHTQESNR